MDARRFTGRTVREAYAAVRGTLGKEAIILEQTRSGGRVELLATLEEPLIQVEERQGLSGAFRRKLADMGFPMDLIETVPAAGAWEQVLRSVVGRIVVERPPEPLTGVWRLVGPSGAGKTSLLIKILTETVLRGIDRARLLVIATDQQRLGGAESLALATELLGVRLVSAEPADVPRLLVEAGEEQLVLVDTAGADVNRLTPLKGVRDVAVLPANWQQRALERLQHSYRRLGVQARALSFVDQADQLGPALCLLMDGGAPLAWISTGDRLPDDLEQASHDWLLERLLGHVDQARIPTMFA